MEECFQHISSLIRYLNVIASRGNEKQQNHNMSTPRQKQDLLFIHAVDTSYLSLFDVHKQESGCGGSDGACVTYISIPFKHSQLHLSGGYCPNLQPCC